MKATMVLFTLIAIPAAAQLQPAPPSSVGMLVSRLDRAAAILEARVKSGDVGAASILVARRGKIVLDRAFGKRSPEPGSPPVERDSIFLLASITKPVTGCALMLLVERGMVSLDDPVSQYLPEFVGPNREKVRVRDLLSHTSGMPDMLPENIELRRAHAPLSEFVKHAFTTPLLYPPREDFRYQSMGILLAGEIVERVSGMRLREFEKKEIFEPLGMKNSALGMKPGWQIRDTVWCMEGPNADRKDAERLRV